MTWDEMVSSMGNKKIVEPKTFDSVREVKEEIIQGYKDMSRVEVVRVLRGFQLNAILTDLTVEVWISGILMTDITKRHYINRMKEEFDSLNYLFVEELQDVIFTGSRKKILEMFYKYSRG